MSSTKPELPMSLHDGAITTYIRDASTCRVNVRTWDNRSLHFDFTAVAFIRELSAVGRDLQELREELDAATLEEARRSLIADDCSESEIAALRLFAFTAVDGTNVLYIGAEQALMTEEQA